MNFLKQYKQYAQWHGKIKGFIVFCQLVIIRLIRPVFDFEAIYLFERILTGSEPKIFPKIPINIQQATVKDFLIIKKHNTTYPDNYMSNRLSDGEICFVAKNDCGDICGYFWSAVGPRQFVYRSKVININKDEAYIRDIQTLPQYRGNNITPYVLSEINGYLSSRGISKVYAVVKCFNYPSCRSFLKAGFRVGTKIRFFKNVFFQKDVVFK